MALKMIWAVAVAIAFGTMLGLFGCELAKGAATEVACITMLDVTQTQNKYKLADLLQQLAKKGFTQVDTEQGQKSPRFDSLSFGDSQNPLKGLADTLASQNWGYEMHGPALILYDNTLRASDDANPLNRKIASFALKGVSLDECFNVIGSKLNINLTGGAGIFTNNSIPSKLDFQLNDGTLRNALFDIVHECHAKTWMFHTYSIGTNVYYEVYIQ